MYKEYLALNDQQWLVRYKSKPNQSIYIWFIVIISYLPTSSPGQDMTQGQFLSGV